MFDTRFFNFCGVIFFAAILGHEEVCLAQYEARTSSTGVEAAEIRKESKKTFNPEGYNVKWGPFYMGFNAGFDQEYNDNIGLAQSAKETDFITTPHLGIEAHWPISQLNELALSLELAYAKYWDHSELDTNNILITPNSALDFNVYVSDVRLNLHDKISIQQDPATVSQLSGVSTFQRMTNTVGIGAEWDLNLVTLNGGFDHETFTSLDDQFSSLDRSTDTLSGKAGVKVTSRLTAGPFASYAFTVYDRPLIQNDSDSYTIGVFGDMMISEYLRAEASVASQSTSFDRGGSIRDATDFGSEIYSFNLRNQLNQWIYHTVGFRRNTVLGIGSNFTDIHEVNYQVTGEAFRGVTASINFYYQFFEDSSSLLAEDGDRYGITPQLGYQLFEPTRLSLGYQRTEKISNRSKNNYEQNRIFLNVTHRF